MTPDRQQAPPNTAALWALVVAMLGFAACAAWWVAKPTIIAAAFAVADAMLAAASVWTSGLEPLREQVAATSQQDPTVTPLRLLRLLTLAGGPWAWPATAILAAGAIACFRKASASRFTRNLDADALLNELARMFPTSAPFAARRLTLAEPPAQGAPRPLDPALHLPEWVDRFARRADRQYSDVMAQAGLAAQLGPLWSGARSAPPIHRVLFAAFGLHAAREQQQALALLGKAARSLSSPSRSEGPAGPNAPLPLAREVVAEADEALRDPDIRLPCEQVARRHAYASTAMMSVLCHARLRGGVLNPGLFAWVQFVDRGLYMALDTLGAPMHGTAWHRGPAPAPLVEGIAASEHWTRELEARRPLPLPGIDASLRAVRVAAGHTA